MTEKEGHLAGIRAKGVFIFDIEGVLMDHIDIPKPYPYATEFLSELRRMGKKLLVLTNITRRSRRAVQRELEKGGFSLSIEEVITAGSTVASFLERNRPRERCFVIGEEGLLADLLEAGVEIVTGDPVGVVVVGANRRVTYDDMRFAMDAVMKGAELICAGGSPRFRGSFLGREGLFLGEAAIAEAIKVASGKDVRYIGKPHSEIFEEALRVHDAKAEDVVMVGDILSSDIRGAKAMGIATVFVSKGRPFVADEKDRPDLVVRDIQELRSFIVG